MISFVIGNGKSRSPISLESLRPFGKIYGCNALYREFYPDYLIAVDPKMIYEIQESGYQLSHEVWTNKVQNHIYHDGFKYFEPFLRWSSGPAALQLSVSHHPTEVYILGFDFKGIDGKFNNIYADTKNYNSCNSMEIYWGNWEKQTEFVIRNNPNIQFYRVVTDDFYDTGWKFSNYKNIKIEVFLNLINTFLIKNPEIDAFKH